MWYILKNVPCALEKKVYYSPFGWKVLKIPIITLNVKGLDAPIKRYRLTEWVQNQDPCICCLQVTHFRPRHTYRLKVKGGKKIFHGNRNKKRARVAILTSDKIDFKIKHIMRDKEGHCMMIKGSIQEEDITIVKIYTPNIGTTQYIRQTFRGIRGENQQ